MAEQYRKEKTSAVLRQATALLADMHHFHDEVVMENAKKSTLDALLQSIQQCQKSLEKAGIELDSYKNAIIATQRRKTYTVSIIGRNTFSLMSDHPINAARDTMKELELRSASQVVVSREDDQGPWVRAYFECLIDDQGELTYSGTEVL